MSGDRRLTPANDRVAHVSLRGQVEGVEFFEGVPAQIRVPVTDLCRAPGGPRDRQLLLGAAVTVLEDRDGWSFLQEAGGYVGYVASGHLGGGAAPDHRVGTFATHAYAEEDFKSPERVALPFGARLKVLDERRRFYETDQGFVPKSHLRPLDRPFEDPVTVAQIHFGVPYLWGGNSTRGIDCSGLVSAALGACGIACPADSDLQRAALGEAVTDAPRRGDLVFWKGHVAMMVDEAVMLHANAHHMACRYEPFEAACLRIEAQGDGPVLVRKRLG